MSWYFFIFPHVLKYCLLFKIKAPPDAFSGQIEGVTYLAREWPRSWSCHAGLGVACSRYRSREQLILNDLIEGLPPMPPTPGSEMCQAEAGHCLFLQGIVCQLTGLWMLSLLPIHISSGLILTLCLEQAIVSLLLVQHWQNSSFAWRHRKQQSTWK